MRFHSLISFSGLALSVTAKSRFHFLVHPGSGLALIKFNFLAGHHGDPIHSAILARQLAVAAQATPIVAPANIAGDVESLEKTLDYLVCQVAEQTILSAQALGTSFLGTGDVHEQPLMGTFNV